MCCFFFFFIYSLRLKNALPLQDFNSVLVNGSCQIPDPLYKLIGSIVSFYIPLLVMILTYTLTVRHLAAKRQNLQTGISHNANQSEFYLPPPDVYNNIPLSQCDNTRAAFVFIRAAIRFTRINRFRHCCVVTFRPLETDDDVLSRRQYAFVSFYHTVAVTITLRRKHIVQS